MNLAPQEVDKLLIYLAADLARKRLSRGVPLNVAEAAALISEAILEAARDGQTVAGCMALGKRVVTSDQVMPGVPEVLHLLQVEAMFADGSKLVSCHDPIARVPSSASGRGVIPGEYFLADEPVEINTGRRTARATVSNTGDRAVQIGSHFHFFEVNRALAFDRAAAYGMRLDIAAGTAARFEPGDTREVALVAFGGERRAVGFNGLVMGALDEPGAADRALAAAEERGFAGAGGKDAAS